jgi:C4-type Zn-finger protein
MIEIEEKIEKVRILCPACGKVCDAVERYWDGFPWRSYVHYCEHCGYVITESEWERVK